MKRILVLAATLLSVVGASAAFAGSPVSPTSLPVTKAPPLNFRAAAAAEQRALANQPPKDEAREIEEIAEPGPPPPFPKHVAINPQTVTAAAAGNFVPESTPLSGNGPSPAPSKTFKAEFLNGTTIPPDTMGAVGTTHIVTVSNDRMRILTRDGVELSRLTLTSFWSGLLIKGSAISAFDPKVYFDRFNSRFILVSSGNGQGVNSGAMFAVSATADPTGTWYRWSVAADPSSTASGGHWIDYPTVGHNKNWIVVDENVFNFGTAGSGYFGQQIYVLDKQAAYANTLGSISLFQQDFNTCLAAPDPSTELGCGFTMAPAITEDNTTDTEYLVEDWDNVAAQLRLSKITGTPAAPVLTVATQFPQSTTAWRFDAVRIGTSNGNCAGTCSGGYMPQRQQSANLTSGTRIMANDSRIQDAVLRGGSLWTVHTVMLSATPQPAGTTIGGSGNPIDNHSGIDWWQIDPTIEGGLSTPAQQIGRIEDPSANNCHNGLGGTSAIAPCNGTTAAQFGEFFAYPNISVNQNGDIFIGFSRLSPLTYPNSGYVIRHPGDPAGTVHDPVIFRPGQSNYNIGGGSGTARQNRWGDYSESQTDPLDDTTFWTIQEYAGTNRNDFLSPSYAGPWETWWSEISPTGTLPTTGSLIINELRLRGPQGVRDEFVELYNPSNSPVIVETTDGSDGWALVYSNNGTTVTQVFAVVPNGTVVPAHGHFLVTDNPDNTAGGTSALTYSLNAAPSTAVRGADSDTGWSLDLADNGGIALFNTATTANFAAGTELDAVGFSSIAAGLFKEGNGIPAVTAATPTGQMTFFRDRDATGTPKDTGVNENDFLFANTVVGETLGSNPTLGAAGPENLGSPTTLSVGSPTLTTGLVDTGVGTGSAPNLVRDPTVVTNGAFGTLSFDRAFTNGTGEDITRLRFRVVSLSTSPASGPNADLRLLSAGAAVVSLSGGGTANVSGTTLETPPAQAAGGGLNGSLNVADVNLTTPLTSGSSINLRFTTGVQVTGHYTFCLVPESDVAVIENAPICFSGTTENTPPSITPASAAAIAAGDPAAVETVATVSDAQDSAGSLTVTATSIPAGISFTGITNTAGAVTATIAASCSVATGTYNVGLQVADSEDATANALFPINVTATPPPTTPTINGTTNGTGTQNNACTEQPLTLTATSTGATSYQWYLNGNPIGGATSSTYQTTGGGTFTVTATNNCGTTVQSAGYLVTDPTPAKPVITAFGPTTFCSGSSVTLQSSSATGDQWFKNTVAIGGATSQNYVSTLGGSYTVQTVALGCHSPVSDPTVVTVNPTPDATITAPASILAGTAGNASVASAGGGATYNWSITNGTIDSGAGSNSIGFTAGTPGTLTLGATVTLGSCFDNKSAVVTVLSLGIFSDGFESGDLTLWNGGSAP